MDDTADVAVPEPVTPETAAQTHKKITHRKLEFHAAPGQVLPHKEGGRYWHNGSRHVVPADEAAALLTQPGFREVTHG